MQRPTFVPNTVTHRYGHDLSDLILKGMNVHMMIFFFVKVFLLQYVEIHDYINSN
jgi:hypothetical protein